MRWLVLRLLLSAEGCSSAEVGAGSPTPTRAICPVTTPPPVAMTPPPTAGVGPNPTLIFRAGQGSFLFGNDGLIVLLPDDGTFHPSDAVRGLPGGIKLGWWRIAHGDLTITTRRLDAGSTPFPANAPAEREEDRVLSRQEHHRVARRHVVARPDEDRVEVADVGAWRGEPHQRGKRGPHDRTSCVRVDEEKPRVRERVGSA